MLASHFHQQTSGAGDFQEGLTQQLQDWGREDQADFPKIHFAKHNFSHAHTTTLLSNPHGGDHWIQATLDL